VEHDHVGYGNAVHLEHRLILYLTDFASFCFAKGAESESLVQSGGVGCEQEFHYGQILTLERLRRLARQSKLAAQARRFLPLALIYHGGWRLDAALPGNVTRQIVRDRVIRFNTNGPGGLIDGKAPG
jgi:hypothetical protein